MKQYEKFIETSEFPSNTHIKITVYYSKGGTNYLSGAVNRRGCYVSVMPVKVHDQCVSCILGTGLMELISETQRYSQKQFNVAVEMSKARVPELINELTLKQKSA